MAAVIHTRMTSPQVRQLAATLAGILSGREPDRFGIARGFRLRLAVAFLSKVKQAFIAKSRGGTDDAGISWPPLTREYLAYGRRFGRGEQAALKRAAGLGKAHRYAPGNDKGLLTKGQLERWRSIYAQSLKWLMVKMSLGEAKARAAQIAWAKLKAEGARTKLDVFGSRQVEILRDTGVLFNSLSPGVLTSAGADASYSPPQDQIVRLGQSDLVVGTNVAYAGAHHAARNPRRRRPLWPEPDQVPQAWWDAFETAGERGIAAAVVLLAGGRAA